jgi:glycosyltransferase involved in cell wall biosynthesis
MEDLVAAASVVVVPLQKRDISIGQSVVVQAMALGRPVIATSLPATIDYIDHMRNGILVPPADVAALREALEATRDPELRRRLGRAARATMADRNVPQVYSRRVREQV